MLRLFLDLPSKLENIILLFPRAMQKSSYHNAAALEKRIKDRRLIRNTCNTSHARINKQSPIQSKSERSSRGSRKIKHAKEKTTKKINAAKLILRL